MHFRMFLLALYLLSISPARSILAQTAQNPVNDGSTSAELEHALQNLDQLSRLARLAAPTQDLRKVLDQKSLPSLKATFGIMAADGSLPTDSRQAAKSIIGVKHVEGLSAILSLGSTDQALSLDKSGARVPIEDSAFQLYQVLTPQLPAMSVRAISPSSPGILNITACMTSNGFFPRVDQTMSQNTTAIRQLSNSVGRIEIKNGNGIPELYGTGFVVDQPNGIIATACHIANDIADYDASTKTWALPAKKLGESAQVLLDFGVTDAHDPQNEFAVTSVAFVPSVAGCDGALLKVETSSGKPLPPALTLSKSELPSPLNSFVDVFSVGYPSRDLSFDTPASRDYFTCIRSADPTSAKFIFGGEITQVEPESGYHILTHIIPTVGGQSGSPVIEILGNGEMQVVGIHMCCTRSALVQSGPSCQLRKEPFLQEAVSIVDIMRLANDQGSKAVSAATMGANRGEAKGEAR